ncbi:hypothetical protein [Kribbella sp. CA-293567]|uniref:hypothetical protein n=1 Tax=Kribbella sp. CA-293567 TaxID=3002436 RepID=UPI0022DD2A8E|nr:hypothetical protein [Kribbella sp. CA-293567]WBQ02200.1 hypothetical protein OX958_19645 [Kribbella sp. CA-293567]
MSGTPGWGAVQLSAVHSALPRLIALTAVLLIPVSCGQQQPGSTPAAVTSTSPAAVPVPTAPATTRQPADLTQATFAPKVLGALTARGGFRVSAAVQEGRKAPKLTNALVYFKGRSVDVATKAQGGGGLVRVGRSIYLQDAKLTGDAQKPWAELDLDSTAGEEKAAAAAADSWVSDRLVHQLIGGAPYATLFQPAGEQVIDHVTTQQYTMRIDLQKAVAAGALGEYVGRADLKSLPKQLSVTVWVDPNALPRKLEFNRADTAAGSVTVSARFGQFGRRSLVLPPKPAKLGTADFS